MQETRLKVHSGKGCRIKLKDEIKWETIAEMFGFEPRETIPTITDDYLIWYSYWDKCDAHGFWEYVEINKGSREVRNQGCLWLIYDMIEAGMLEKVTYAEHLTTWSGGIYGNFIVEKEIQENCSYITKE